VDLEEFLTIDSYGLVEVCGFEGGQSQGRGKVFLEDRTLWYEGEF